MNKKMKRNLVFMVMIGVAVLYGLVLSLTKKVFYWDYAFDGLLLVLQSLLYGLAAFAIASLVYHNLGKLVKSNILAKVISFVVSVIAIYLLLVVLLLVQGVQSIDFFSYLQFQLLPDIENAQYILSLDVIPLPAKLTWVAFYITVWLKYYIAALFFFLLAKADKKETDVNALDGTYVSPQSTDSLGTSDQTSDTSTNPLPSFCPHCGAPVTGTGKFCSVCGKPLVAETVKPNYTQSTTYYPGLQPDVPSTGFNILAFFVPMVGLILYAIWNSQFPKKAKAIGKWALIGFISSIVSMILFYALFFSFYMSLFSNYQ